MTGEQPVFKQSRMVRKPSMVRNASVAGRPGLWRKAVVTAAIGVCLAMSPGASRGIAALGDTRTLSIYNIHTKETVSIVFRKDGKPVAGAHDKLNWALRDWRRNEKTTMDPALFDLLWDIHTELGSKQPIHVISAFRSRGTNDMLRTSVGGQASESRHILGKAMDVHFPDIDVKKIRYSALIRERGGVGYYPTSALPFVHVDTDRVRAWPRLPRGELALLFPNGKTQHQPADGGPITLDDVRTARSQDQRLAAELAAYHGVRTAAKSPVALADASAAGTLSPTQVMARPLAVAAAELRLVEAPRVIDRPSRMTGPGVADRQKLAELMKLAALEPTPRLVQAPQPIQRPAMASLTGTPQLPPAVAPKPASRIAAVEPTAALGTLTDALTVGWGNGFVAASYDDEHPDELSYRPFPIAPLLTLTASPDDPALARLQHPDVAKTLDMLDNAGSAPPMKLRPGVHVAASLWAQQFSGDAVRASTFTHEPPAASAVARRSVATSVR
jgi:uncharacterized protein YcbK (DUF882 family)